MIIFKKKPNWKEIHSPISGCKAYRWGDVTVIVGYEGDHVGWHLSISTRYRLPTWDEIKAARYEFVPNEATMAMLLPPMEEYINVHDYCLHLYEVTGDAIPAFSGNRKILAL